MDHVRPSPAFRLWRRIVFGVGDVKTNRECYVRPEEYEPIIPELRPGDVILHRDDRFWAANWFIGGCMIHAGIYIGNREVVESVSEGVKRRDVKYILESDYTIVVRPSSSQRSRYDACELAKALEGFEYDPLFDFCDATEFEAFDQIRSEFIPSKWAERAKEHDIRFCCTEIPFFCYYKLRGVLGLWRRQNVSLLTKMLGWIGLHPGSAVIDADIYVAAPGFEIVWCSSTVTQGWVARMGACEPAAYKLNAHIEKSRAG